MRKITDYNGTILPVDGVNLYGNIKDDPSGTAADRVSNSDLQVFFQRMADLAGITPNSLPDNATNGFQLTQALNKLYCRRLNGLASAFGASGLTPVIMSGCVDSGSHPTYNVGSGYFFYNGQLVFLSAATGTIPTLQTLLVNISSIDNQPIATVTTGFSVSPSSSQFNFSLLSSFGYSAWSAVSGYLGGWGAGSPTPRISKNVLGDVVFQGSIAATNVTTLGLFTLPAGYRPTQINILTAWLSTAAAVPVAVSVNVDQTTGILYLTDPSLAPGATFLQLFIDSMKLVTL